MKRFRFLVFIIGLLIVYAMILCIPTVKIQATYPSQTSEIHYTLMSGILQKRITEGKISFLLNYDLNHTFLIFCCATLATICISLKKGRLIGLCLYFIVFVFLSFNADVTVFSQELQAESHEIHESPSLFLLIHPFVYVALYSIQGWIIKRETRIV